MRLAVTLCFVFVVGVAINDALGKTVKHKEKQQWKDKHDGSNDSDEIIGGEEVEIEQFPFQVAVLLKDNPKEDLYFPIGSGTILNEDYVLTCAHCVWKREFAFRVRVGSSYIFEGGTLYKVEKNIRHPKYDIPKKSYDYDVGLIKTAEKIKMNGVTVKPVKLPNPENSLKPGDNIVVTGWGKFKLNSTAGLISHKLRAVTVPVTSKEYCSNAIKLHLDVIITDRMMCAGLEEGGKDACQGDSGGPAFDERNLVQYGITSFGVGCAQKGIPGVYAYVPAIRNWIKEITGV